MSYSDSTQQEYRRYCHMDFDEAIHVPGHNQSRRRTMPELNLLLVLPKEEGQHQQRHSPSDTPNNSGTGVGTGGHESSDSGTFSEEEDLSSSSSSFNEDKKKNWLLPSMTNLITDIFKAEQGGGSSPIIIQEPLMLNQNPFNKNTSYYCVSPACQTFGKTKSQVPSKKKYSNGRLIPLPLKDPIKPYSPIVNRCLSQEQHSTVWIQLLPDILPYDSPTRSPPILQIKHSCSNQNAINYREDLSSKMKQWSNSDRNKILWYRYLGRQVESDLVKSTDEEESNYLSLKLRHLSRQICGRCGSGFSMLFNRRLQCSYCQLGVCKNCCKKLTMDGNWICDACTEKKELQRQSCEWFYDHLHKSFNDFGSAKIMKSISHNEHSSKLDENSSQVRDHIEKVVEALIGENIDQVNINRLVNDAQYDGLFKDYHEKLSDALAGLVLAIQLVMENRTIEDENTTPTTAHIKLKNLINQLIIDAGKFKKAIMVTPETLHHSFRPQEEESSYEDLLATAIINKVVTSTRQKYRGQPKLSYQQNYHQQEHQSQVTTNTTTGEESMNTTSSISEERRKSLILEEELHAASSEESGRGASASPSSTPHARSSSSNEEEDSLSFVSPHETVSNESADEELDSSWIRNGVRGDEIMIQEEIEEVTTTIYDDQITEKIIVRKNPKIRSATSCPTLSSLDTIFLSDEDTPDYVPMTNDSTVPFPELGLDVTNASSSSHSSTGWEENWFFRKQHQQSSQPSSKFVKLSALVRLLTDDPVSMLVPNPNEDMRPQIGARDVDEISELSERNSVGSIEFSTSSSEGEEEESEAKAKSSFKVNVSQMDVLKATKVSDLEYSQEANVEHTEYSVPAEVKKSSFSDRGNVEFLERPSGESSVTSGKILELQCTCSRSVDVAWFRNANPIHDDMAHYEIWRQKRGASGLVDHFLRIYDLRATDSGDYRVVAYNDDGEKWHDFKVQANEYSGQNYLPEIFCFPDSSHSEHEGHAKKFICQVKGHPEPRLFFYKDGKRLNRNENISIEYYKDYGEWSLSLRRVSPRDVGLYEVMAENQVGSCKRSWTLSVLPKPQAPPTVKPPPIPADLDEGLEEGLKQDIFNLEDEEGGGEESSDSGLASPKYAHPHQRGTKKHLAEAINPSVIQSTQYSSVSETDMKFDQNEGTSNEESTHNTPPGSIADREHRKWVELAVNMPNNPYSKESIEKRQSLKNLSRKADGGFMPTLSMEDVQEVRNDADTPSRIYCGLKSVDDALYRRDYYINKNDDAKNSAHSTSFQKELDFEPINKNGEDKVNTNQDHHTILNKSPVENEEIQEEDTTLKADNHNMSELSNEFSSICSLNEMQDSGMGSSCERSSLLAGKVEAEILRFQKDIEKVNKEKSELLNWQMKKIEKRRKCPPKEIGPPRRYYSSMDSLLSITEDSSSPDPGGHLSSSSASATPTSEQQNERNTIISDRSIKNLNKKQVSISENSTVIISCYEDDDDRLDDSTTTAILPSVKKLVNKFMPNEPAETMTTTTTTTTLTTTEVKPNVVKAERKSKNRFNYNSIRTSNEIPMYRFNEPIHSLTARSVPRQFREGLKNGLTHFTDKNIKIPGSDTSGRSGGVSYGISEDDYYEEEEDSAHRVIYDSKQQQQQLTKKNSYQNGAGSSSSSASSRCNTLESTRTPSPEHVGIPASRVRLTPKKRSDVTTTYCYTSDESTNNELYDVHRSHHHPPASRRKQMHNSASNSHQHRLSYQC